MNEDLNHPWILSVLESHMNTNEITALVLSSHQNMKEFGIGVSTHKYKFYEVAEDGIFE